MKAALTVVAGFTLTLGVFVSGALVATWFLAAAPVHGGLAQDQTGLWSDKPVPVTLADQELERLPARMVLADSIQPGVAVDSAPAGVDPLLTAAINPTVEDQRAIERLEGLLLAHGDWCASRYRSYRAEDNSYRSYRGSRRECFSPHSDALASAAADWDGQQQPGIDGYSDTGATLTYVAGATGPAVEHVAYCRERYRSYRVEDNTYQPYGGGPRRQCG